MTSCLTADVVIIGAGPAGLTAAALLAPHLDGRVLVLERERAAGGSPCHSDHPGYGIRDLKRFVSGPAYARALVDRATSARAEIRTEATVTGWAGDRSLEVTTPQGRLRVDARAVVLATGARERPRGARLIPGDRPFGVCTTGHLQNLVHLHHQEIGHQQAIGRRAVVVGAEPVSWSAVLTLRKAGCRTVLMTTQHPTPDTADIAALDGRHVAEHVRLPRSFRTYDRQPEAGRCPVYPSAVWSSRVILLPAMGDLVTARLVLHPMTVSEAERVVAGESDSGARWAPGYPTDGDVSAARRFLGTCANTGDPQPFGNYEIRRRENGQAIGGLGFHGPADENGSVTIGYGLIPSARGKGYASEALRGLLLIARARGVTCVKGDADHDNIASQHVMMAAGMRPAGEDERVRYFEIAWTNTTAITDPRS